MIVYKGSIHWYIQRFSAILLFVYFVLVFFFDLIYPSFITAFFVVLFYHVDCGVETFIFDYMHDINSILIASILLDVFSIYFIKSVFLFFVFI